MLIPKTNHALRKMCAIVLSKHVDSTTLDDVEQVKSIFQTFVDTGLSPKQIQEKYNLKYTDFGMFMKRCLCMTIRSHKSALQNFHINHGTHITDQKIKYKQECEFRFSINNLKFIPGIEHLSKLGMYHPIKNPNGLVKDHMISKEYGWLNKIDPKLISHPANCRLITNQENITKGSTSSMTLQDLLERIDNINIVPTELKIALPKSDEHKKKISESISRYKRITNGKENLRILKSDAIPEGYRAGFTRKNRMVP